MKAFIWMCIYVYFLPVECRKSYEGHRVLRIIPNSEEDLHNVEQLFSPDDGFDVWQSSTTADSPFDVRLSAEQYAAVQQKLIDLDLVHAVMVSDVQAAADDQQRRLSSCTDCFDFSHYHQLEEINEWIHVTVQTYPDMAEVITVSESYENRTIYGIKIRSSSSLSGIWIEGGIHAREWIAPATVMYVTSKILESYSNGDYRTIEMVDGFQWFIVPVLNVDGYAYTWTNDRLWRKTRSKNLDNPECDGVDPNRNWDYEWGPSTGSSSNACSQQYRGPKAFSEPCVSGVSEYLLHLSNEISFKVFLDFHSYSQMWMSPWGYTEEVPGGYVIQDEASLAAVLAINETSGKVYKHGPIATTIYKANGNSVDWAYGVLGANFSATVELRDNGTYGFLLPPDQIIPCGEEIYAGVQSYVEYVTKSDY